MSNYDDKTMDEILEMDKLEYQEDKNPLRPDELKDPHRIIKIELLGIIAAYQDPVRSDRIYQDFEEMNGYPLDVSKYGFKSFTSMMRCFSDKFVCHEVGMKFMWSAKKTERSGHLQELIENQVSIEETRRRREARSRSFSRNRKSSYGAGIFYAQNFVPLLMDDRTLEERTADNLASFGRSLAAQDVRAGLNWGGRKSRVEASSDDSDSDCGGLIVRSKSVPASRASMRAAPIVFDDPRCLDDDLEDCTNPFSVQNNVRIRDLVIKLGEEDDQRRKGMAVVEVAFNFKKEYRQPLGGVPNLSEERIHAKMAGVATAEWTVEQMGDGHAYVIIPAKTIERAHEVGPGTPCTPPTSAEKPKSTGVSPAAKRMFGFALKEAVASNTRQTGTREKVVLERKASASTPPQYGADSDGDPVAMEDPEEQQQEVQRPPRQETRAAPAISREVIIALSHHDVLDPRTEAQAGQLRLLRKQMPSPRSSPPSSSSATSLGGMRGQAQQRPSGFNSRVAPLESSSMWGRASTSPAAPSSSTGFGGNGGGAPSFGTFGRSAAPPAPAAAPAAAAAKVEEDCSDIMQPSASNLASKMPSFGSALKPATGFSPQFSAQPAADRPMFGTSSQSVPSFSTPAAAAAATPSPTPAARPSFGTSFTSPTPTFAAPAAPAASFPSSFKSSDDAQPKKMVEVVEKQDPKKLTGTELLDRTNKFLAVLRSGEVVKMRDIEGTPMEDVVVGNLDFFDVDDSKDECVHLLHKDVDPKLLMVNGKTLGDLIKKEEPETAKKEETPVVVQQESRAGSFSRPPQQPPTFNRPPIPTFGGVKPRELPTFGGARPAQSEEERSASAMSTTRAAAETSQPAMSRPDAPLFGTASRKLIEVIEEKQPEPAKSEAVSFGTRPVERPASGLSVASSYESAASRAGSGPSFGTKSHELPRPDSALSNRTDEARKAPSFAAASRATERPESVMSERSETTQLSRLDSSADSIISSSNDETQSSIAPASISASVETLEMDEKEKKAAEVVEEETGPFAFPTHRHIARLCKKPYLAFDDCERKGDILCGAVLTSFNPNRIVLTLLDGDMMSKLEMLMTELRSAYVDKPSVASVSLGQFAVAINGDCLVRVVVLREKSPNYFECACLDVNAVIHVDATNLFDLIDKFSVSTLRSSTFIARINGVKELTDAGHKAVKLVAKSEESDENLKMAQPFVFHGKHLVSGDLVVDVAALIGQECAWLGEKLPAIFKEIKKCDAKLNPNIEHAIDFAIARHMDGYKKKVAKKLVQQKVVVLPEQGESDVDEDTRTLRSASVEKMQERAPVASPSEKQSREEEKEEGELDSSHDDSNASERTIMDMHAAGDFVRDVKQEVVDDEFVIAAPSATKAIVDVQSMLALIKHLNEKGENVEADVIKSICRALILSVNKNLMSLGDRGALIANAEALDAIDMA